MHTQSLQIDDCFAIRQAARRISQFYERYLSEVGVTPSQYSVLIVMDRNPSFTMAHLSAVLVVERTTLLRTLKPLVKAGLIVSRYEGRASRRLVFDLTDGGRQKLAEATLRWQAAQEAFEQRLGAERAAHLRTELLRIKDDIAA